MLAMAGEINIENLFPAIVQAFVIILIGYLFGRFRVVEPTEARSISTLVGKLALPALLAKNLLVLDLSTVSWRFLASILIAKLAIFVLVVAITFITIRPWNLGKAGLYGIFATQSNDFALGLPIVQALYGTKAVAGEFFYASYLYLLAPISLLIINPIGFFMLEYTKQKSRPSKSRCYQGFILLLKTLCGVCVNPVVFMTFLGVAVNSFVTYAIHKQLPDWLLQFLDILGGAYASCALFSIGIFMVGRIKTVSGNSLFVGGLLIVAKSVILPMIGYLTVSRVTPNEVMNSTNEELSAFGFLYCTFPTAPTVFIYASQYNTAMTVVASSLVFGTILSAPIMYVSARMVLIQFESDDEYAYLISNSKRDVSIVAMACVVWVFCLFIVAKRFRSLLYVIVMHMIVAMFIECLFGILLDVIDKLTYWPYLIFSLFFIGVFASRLWLAWLAFSLLLYVLRGPAAAEKLWYPMLLTSWGVPMVTTAVMVLSSPVGPFSPHISRVDKSFQFGTMQLVVSLLFLCTAFLIGTVSVLVLLFKVNTKRKQPQRPESSSIMVQVQHRSSYGSTQSDVPPTPTSGEQEERRSQQQDSCSSPAITESKEYMSQTLGPLPGGDMAGNVDKSGLTRFFVLLVFLLFSCLVGILIVFWKLVSNKIDGIFIAVNILDNVMNFGQGFFLFLVFGFEKYWFWTALYNKVRKFLFKIETVALPDESELSVATINLCNTFKLQYLNMCKEDIVSDKRYLIRVYPSVFSGYDLVSWLIEKGLARTREDAVVYGQTLLEGRLLAHISEEHNFYDESYYYRFKC